MSNYLNVISVKCLVNEIKEYIFSASYSETKIAA